MRIHWNPDGRIALDDGRQVVAIPDHAAVTLERRDGITALQITLPIDGAYVDTDALVALGSAVGQRATVEAFLDGIDPDSLSVAIVSGGASTSQGTRALARLRDEAVKL